MFPIVEGNKLTKELKMIKTKLFILNNDGSTTSSIFNDRLLAIKTGERWVTKRARAISYEVFQIYKSDFSGLYIMMDDNGNVIDKKEYVCDLSI